MYYIHIKKVWRKENITTSKSALATCNLILTRVGCRPVAAVKSTPQPLHKKKTRMRRMHIQLYIELINGRTRCVSSYLFHASWWQTFIRWLCCIICMRLYIVYRYIIRERVIIRLNGRVPRTRSSTNDGWFLNMPSSMLNHSSLISAHNTNGSNGPIEG